jgi:hypothetical protein
MRIEGPRQADSVRKNEKTRKSSGVSGAFSALLSDEADGPSEARGPSAVADVGALIAAQAVEDPTERKARKRMQDRAERVLEALDGVHRGLLSGSLSTADLNAVKAGVSERREKINDPRLLGILDEVDLRAQVELAKLELARDKKR